MRSNWTINDWNAGNLSFSDYDPQHVIDCANEYFSITDQGWLRESAEALGIVGGIDPFRLIPKIDSPLRADYEATVAAAAGAENVVHFALRDRTCMDGIICICQSPLDNLYLVYLEVSFDSNGPCLDEPPTFVDPGYVISQVLRSHELCEVNWSMVVCAGSEQVDGDAFDFPALTDTASVSEDGLPF